MNTFSFPVKIGREEAKRLSEYLSAFLLSSDEYATFTISGEDITVRYHPAEAMVKREDYSN